MSTIGKIAVVIVILVIIFVVSMLLAGYFSDNYGWNVYLNVDDKKDGISFKEYHSGNVVPGSEPRVVYTNDHSLGQLYSAPLGGADVSPDKVLWTKMHVDEADYPNPTKRTELRRFNDINTSRDEVSVSIEASGSKVNSNAVIIQPGSSVDYNANFYQAGKSFPSYVIGIKDSTKYSLQGSRRVDREPDGRVITTLADGSKQIRYKDGRVDNVSPSGDVVTTSAEVPINIVGTADGSSGTSDAGKAEGFSTFDLVDFNVDAFIADGPADFSKIYASQRDEQGGLPKDTFSPGVLGATGFADIYERQRAEQGGLPKDTFGIDESLVGDEGFDIESSIGIAEPTSTNFLYEIEKENLVIDDYVRSERVMLDSNGDLGLVDTGAVPSGSEGFLSSPDKYYVDVAGNQIYRRRRFTATNDNFHGWNGPYVDAYGNIHYDGFFEPVHGARTVSNWFLPPERLRRTRSTTKVTNTWAPHNHTLKVHVEPRFYDSSFNSSVQEVLTETVLRRDPIGGLIVPAQPVFDSLYILE